MDLNSVKLALYKYKFSSFTLAIGSKKPTVHEVEQDLIMKMTIVEDYDTYFFPYIEVSISVPNNIFRLMKKYSTEIKATINLSRKKKVDMLSTDTEANANFKKVFNQSFYVFLNEASPDLTEEEQEKVEKSEEQYGQLSAVSFLIYPYEFYMRYKKIVNAPLANVTLVEALAYTLNKTGIGNVLLSPPDNYKTYDQFIITPIPFIEQVQRICENYAMHKAGTLIFFGIDRMYIVNKTPKCSAYATNEQKLTYVIYDTETEENSQSGGCYINTKDKYTVINASKIEFNDSSELVSKTAGSGIISVDTEGSTSVISGNGTSDVTTVLVQNEGSDASSVAKHAIDESAKILSASMSDIDISAMTPNKQFIINITGTKYKKYNGKYRLTKTTHTFTKEGDLFQVKTNCEFRG